MGLFDAIRDYPRWQKQEDRSVPTPWKQKLILKGLTLGNRQRLDFLRRELMSPADKSPDELEYLRVELDFFRKHLGV